MHRHNPQTPNSCALANDKSTWRLRSELCLESTVTFNVEAGTSAQAHPDVLTLPGRKLGRTVDAVTSVLMVDVRNG